MSIWFTKPTPEAINMASEKTIAKIIGIEVVEVGDDFIRGRMPVDERTHQPFGILHGGASVVLAESLGSMAANFSVDGSKFYCVGLDINANHISSVRSGWVEGVARPIHIGRSTQVWEIRITSDTNKLVCISRLTMSVLERK
ncbi:MAG TPA: hotdog fold thioesterase [Pseudomonadales bacterium]|nr:hotdog fold thioesterase [Pseudomonadales bacterium]